MTKRVTGEGCQSDGRPTVPKDLGPWVAKGDAAKANVCYRANSAHPGMTVLLLHGWRKGVGAAQAREQGWGANHLIGADRLREPSANFGFLTTEDIVYSAMQA